MSATIIIRTKNSEATIAQVLSSLQAQSFQDFKLRIIDSGSTDDTLSIIEQFGYQVRKIEQKEYFPGKVLNAAVEGTSSPYIVFLNSDAPLLITTALQELIDALSDENVVASFARQIPRPDAKTWVIRDYESAFPKTEAPPWMTLSLPFAAMKKSAWIRRPFYTKAWGSEDTEWGVWAKRLGYEIRYLSNTCVMHSHNYTLRQLYHRRFVEGEADVFIYGGNYRFLHVLLDAAKAITRDILFYIKRGDFIALPEIFPVRFIYYWGYYQGFLHGKR